MRIYSTIILLILYFQFAAAQKSAEENLRIAVEFNKKSKYEASLLFCNKALEVNPNMVNAFFLRGINNYQLENFQEAIVDFTVAIKLKPDFEEVYFHRAKARRAKKDYMGAIKDFNRARELNPAKATLHIVSSLFSSIFSSKKKE